MGTIKLSHVVLFFLVLWPAICVTVQDMSEGEAIHAIFAIGEGILLLIMAVILANTQSIKEKDEA